MSDDLERERPAGIIPNREPGFVEGRRDDGTSVCTLGKPAHIPIDMEDSR